MRRIVLILAILLALAVSFALGFKANPHRCTVVNLREPIAAQHEGLLDLVEKDWGVRGMA